MISDIDEDTVQRVLASNFATAITNFAGPNLHQYRSVAVDFCAEMEIMMSAIYCAIEKGRGKEENNRHMLLWRLRILPSHHLTSPDRISINIGPLPSIFALKVRL